MICVTKTPLAKIFQKHMTVETKVPVVYHEDLEELVTDEKGVERLVTRKIKKQKFETKREVITQHDLLKDPKRIFIEEKFSVTVPLPSGDQTFWYGVPRYISNQDMRSFLTGGQDGQLVQETQFSGVVQVDMNVDAVGSVIGMVTGETGADDIKDQIETGLLKAAEMSRERVMTQVRKVFSQYKGQLAKCKEQGLGEYQPSIEELLCAHVLHGEEEKKRDEQKAIQDEHRKLIESINLV